MHAKIDKYLRASALIALSILSASCGDRRNAVSGTIEVDEVHVGPRMSGRVQKIFAQEGDKLQAGQPIVELDAAELKARRDLAAAQIDTAIHDAESQAAQLEFLRDDAKRQQDLLKRKVVSPTDAEKAGQFGQGAGERSSKPRKCAWFRRAPSWPISTRNWPRCR